MARDITEQLDEMAQKDQLRQDLFAEPEPQQVAPTEVVQEEASIAEQVLGPSQVAAVDDPAVVQTAVLDDIVVGIAKGVKSRVRKAEEAVLPPLPDEAIQKAGTATIIRPATEDEVAALAEATGGEWTKGINFPAIAEGLDDFDMADHMARIKDANQELFEKARRGTMTFDQIKELAAKYGMDDMIAEWLVRNPGSGTTGEKLLGGVMAVANLLHHTRSEWTKIADMPVGEARDAAIRRAYQMQNVTAAMMANVSGAGSEAARSLFVLREAQKGLDIDFARQSEEMINLFGAETVEDMEYMGQLYMALPSPASKASFIKNGMNKAMDMIVEVWINSILTAPTTHMVNVVGNSVFMATRVVEQVPAAAYGAVRTAITGARDKARFRDVVNSLEGIRKGFLDAMIVSGKTLFTEEPSDIVSKIDVRNRRAIGTSGDPRVIIDEIRSGNAGAAAVNMLGISARMGGRFLLAEDEFFKGVGYRMSLHQMVGTRTANMYDELVAAGKTPQEAKQMAAAEGARLMANPPKGLVEDARDAARQMTFQGDLDGFLGDMQGGMSHPVAKLFVPFYKTPTNVMKETMVRSPLMLAYPGFYKKLAAGGREADIAFGQVATGSMISSAFAYMAMGIDDPDKELIIMGSGPPDPEAQQAMMRKGIQPFSINFKNEDGTYTSVTYSRLDPISGMLAMAADFAYYANYEEDQAVIDRLAMAMTMSLAEYTLDMPFLQGVQELTRVFTNADPMIRQEQFMEMIGGKVTEAGLAFVPGMSSFSAGIERMQDPTVSSPMLPEAGLIGEDPTQLPAFMRGFYTELQRAKGRNPFFSDSVPPKLNLWGEKITAGSGEGWEFWSPIRVQDTKFAPIDDELMALGDGIKMPNKKISGVRLNAVQYNKWLTTMNSMDKRGRMPGDAGYDVGQTMLPLLMDIIGTEYYQSLPTKEDKLDKITTVVGTFKTAARKMLVAGDPDLAVKIMAAQ